MGIKIEIDGFDGIADYKNVINGMDLYNPFYMEYLKRKKIRLKLCKIIILSIICAISFTTLMFFLKKTVDK